VVDDSAGAVDALARFEIKTDHTGLDSIRGGCSGMEGSEGRNGKGTVSVDDG
jgi:hypothetical protein